MHFRSKSSFSTLKSIPKGSANQATGLMLQAGFIRQELAGVYNFLPLGLRVVRNIEQIVREEMDAIGGQEIHMATLVAKEKMELTNRWGVDILYKLEGTNSSEYSLGFSHEEVVTPLMMDFLQSYKNLPACVYQFQTKFRKEKRAKSGLLRGREFKMKDAYSFHSSQEDLTSYFEEMRVAYHRIFERAGIGDMTVDALADGGEFTDVPSVEFQTFTDVGEDVLFYDESSDTWYNREVAPTQPKAWSNEDEQEMERKDVEGKGLIGVEPLAKFLEIPVEKTTKTMLYEAENGDVVAIAVRGDRTINEIKVRQILQVKKLQLASEETVKNVTGAEVGYAGPLGLPDSVKVLWDASCEGRKNFECGANQTNHHSINVNFGRDIEDPGQYFDLTNAMEGDINPVTGEEYAHRKASEVGNIFDLGKKYSDAFDIKTTAEDGTVFAPWMGCYGVGITRLMGIIAETYADDKGLIWPESIAPYTHYLIVHGDHLDRAKEIATQIEKEAGKSVLIDDRDCGFGQKAGDADLLGIPHRIVVSDRTQDAQGGYEISERQT